MAASRGRVVWTSKQLFQSLSWFRVAAEKSVQEIIQDFASEVESYMKEHAAWEDRTGDARDGLSAQFYEGPNVSGLLLSHGVSYGIWLEVRWGGRLAIIPPTIEVMGPELMRRIGERTLPLVAGKVDSGASLGAGDVEVGDI